MKKILSPKLMRVYFVFSSFLLVAMLGLFRTNRVRIFLALLCLAFCVYTIVKKKESFSQFKYTNKEIMLALSIESVVFLDYYFNITKIKPGFVMKILSSIDAFIPMNYDVAFFVIGFLICLASFYSVCIMSTLLVKALNKCLFIVKTYRTHFVVLSGVYLLSFIAIIRANYYYVDDLGRTIYGSEMTGDFSRYVANILSEMLHINSWLADISPLAQILALFIMSFTGITALHIISELLEIKPNKWSFLALIPLGLSPYFLSCLSYKYDAPYMALSVLVSVFPLVYYKQSSIKLGLSVFAGTLIMCTTYQVSSGILPMMVGFMSLLMWIKKHELKTIFRFILTSAIGYSTALLIFRFLIMKPIPEDEYVDTSMSLKHLIPNIEKYIDLFNNDFPVIWKIMIALIMVCFVIYTIKNSERNKMLTLGLSLILTIALLLLSFGVYLIFGEPLTDPRSFYGIGVFVSLISVPLVLANKNYLAKISICCLSGFFIVFAFIYGNALSLQKEYISFRTEQVINDLNNTGLLKEDEVTNVQVVGSAGYHKAVRNMIQEYPVLERLIHVMFSDSTAWGWGAAQFTEYYGLNAEVVDISDVELTTENMIKDTYYYSIYTEKDIVIIDLKDVRSQSTFNNSTQ